MLSNTNVVMSAAALPTRSTGFTCLACHVIFPTSERQRNHYRTDWHKYNLKRKIAALAPVSAEQFAQKVLSQQEKNRQELERQALIYECVTCRKAFYSENVYQDHIQSKKHRETYIKQQILKSNSPAHIHKHDIKLAPFFSDHSDLDSDNDSTLGIESAPRDPLSKCLFCTFPSPDFDTNMEHMSREHGFFVPDIEYLVDLRGLISYLSQKIEEDYYCLYCNGRGKEWKSAQAARAHMLDKGHMKMAYDDSEDPEALLQFYDFEPLQETERYSIANETDLVLRDGTRLGHRRNLRFFKQRLRKNREEHQVDRAKAIEEAKAFAAEQGLSRREKRNLLAVTNGRKGYNADNNHNSANGIRETIVRQDFQRQVAVKHNLVETLRARNQVPK